MKTYSEIFSQLDRAALIPFFVIGDPDFETSLAIVKKAIDAGAEDVREDGSNFEVITSPEEFESVKKAIEDASIPYIAAEITMLPQSTVNLAGKEAEQMFKLMEMLDDCDDVQKVYTNADIPDEDHLFLLGDRPDESLDSRTLGPIPIHDLIGRVSYRLWPPARV